MQILAIETSAKAASAALVADGMLKAEYFQNSGQTHSRTLLKLVQDMLQNCDTPVTALDAVACAIGPGSFTGVRIGLAAAKGLCWGADLPLYGVSTLAAMAYGAGLPDGLICPVMDARRSQVYTALFCAEGGKPLAGDDGADRVKLALLNLLFQRYGITEADFLTAELTMVPAAKACEVGLDRSMIGAYGHDDRVCAYAAFAPLLDLDVPSYTAVCVLADKEEIGSVGVSGMQSRCFETFLGDLCQSQGVPLRRCLEHAFCLSADVTNAFDPTFADTCDRRNNAKLNYGIGVCKYTGARGKSGASDAAAEVVGYIAHLFDENDVIWQTATLGKVDQGGGGTVAAYMANRNIDTLDAGVPVLSMHAPMEVVSKLDAYMTAKGMRAFYEAP